MLFRSRAGVLLADDGPLGTAASLARWSARRDQVEPLIDAEAARWGDTSGVDLGRPEWLAEVAWVESQWFPTRIAMVLEQLEADGLWLSEIDIADDAYAPAERIELPTS